MCKGLWLVQSHVASVKNILLALTYSRAEQETTYVTLLKCAKMQPMEREIFTRMAANSSGNYVAARMVQLDIIESNNNSMSKSIWLFRYSQKYLNFYNGL